MARLSNKALAENKKLATQASKIFMGVADGSYVCHKHGIKSDGEPIGGRSAAQIARDKKRACIFDPDTEATLLAGGSSRFKYGFIYCACGAAVRIEA